MKKIIFTLCLLLGATTLSAQRLKTTTVTQEQYEQQVRDQLRLDYSMPDYSISKIDASVMGSRLASILTSLCQNYQQHTYLSTLSAIQSHQIEGLQYARINEMELHRVEKRGNEVTILFDTSLEPNSLKLKKSTLRFHFVDGISDDNATNGFFCTLCKYLRE